MNGLEIGAKKPLLIRTERLGPREPAAWRVLFASDLHLTARREHMVARILEVAVACRPDRVLLGGDLVDSGSGTPVLKALVRGLMGIAPVRAVPGNHDASAGVEAVRSAVLAGGGSWLGSEELAAPGRPRVAIATRLAAPDGPGQRRLLLAHDPAVFPRAVAAGFHFVLAGHLHGGQVVLWQRRGRQYPGALLYRWNGLRFSLGGSTMLVSRGVADTLPLRFRCPREVLLCEVA